MSLLIKEFEDLIKPALKSGQKFVSYYPEKLLSSGENYGSVMLRVQVNVTDENGGNDIIQCVAKTCPPRGCLWEMFNTQETFKTEISIYDTVIPELNRFAKEKGMENLIDFLPEYIASRVSLTGSHIVDEDAVLILENLKIDNYDIGDRFVGFDSQSARLILKDLATLHAIPIAYKFAKPDDFKTKILPFLGKCFAYEMDDKTIDHLARFATNSVRANRHCVPYLKKLEEYARKVNTSQIKPKESDDLFRTIVHNDYWLNNTMLKYEDGKAISNKIVDFQLNDYSSLTHDLVFFLYSSVELSVLESDLDGLYEFYYENFIRVLRQLNCDVSCYSFEAMMEEAGWMAKEVELPHLIMMLPSILKKKEKSEELAEIDDGDFVYNEDCLHENYSKRMQFLLLDFVRRKWI